MKTVNQRSVHLARWISLTALHLAILVQVQGSPRAVTLRLMDARSGKPMKAIKVEIFTWGGSSTTSATHQTWTAKTQATTDENGQAIFQLPEQIPEHFGFLLVPPDDFEGCLRQQFSSEEVLRSGIVASFAQKCGKPKWQASARPGEVVVFEKRLTTLEKTRREVP